VSLGSARIGTILNKQIPNSILLVELNNY
jgi:hypothetical protein